ncbi:MAG: PqqD family protein [Theionarchaea archaeon]|nr:PqqD family protein [Theionarchaea archaeon]
MNLPKVKPEVLIREEPDETYVINMTTGKIFRFNETALKMLEACQEGIPEEELVERLTDEESDRHEVEEDVKKTLEQFRELGLVDNNG